MTRFDRATLRSAGFTCLMVVVFLTVNTTVAHAATGDGGAGGDLLAPLNIDSSEGAPINNYVLSAEGGSIFSFEPQLLAFILSGLFTLSQLLVGLACWAVEVAFGFPLIRILASPAQAVSDAYAEAVVDTLGLKGVLLSWAFVFGLVMFVRGKVGKGLGEIVLTLLIAAFAASAFVRPDYLLSEQGPLMVTQQAAAEVAQQTVNSYDWGGEVITPGPCAGMAGRAEIKCLSLEAKKPISASDVARPIQGAVTNAVIVKPYMLLQYGRILDPADAADKKAYAVHLRWVTGGYRSGEGKNKETGACAKLKGPAKEFCRPNRDKDELPALTPGESLLETANPVLSEEDQQFAAFLKDLEGAGPVGKASAEYAKMPTWWRVCGAALLLLAALMICAILLCAAVVLLGIQAACAGAAAAGGVTFVWAMLPGPSRQALWKWLSIFGISVLSMFAICMFVPFFGIAVDAVLTDGPDLMVERILLLDVLALAGLAFHRRLLAGITSFGHRMSMRMRYAKVGGTHLPGDSSELGAALAMNLPGGGGSSGLLVGPSGAHRALGVRHRVLGSLAAMSDGAGMPFAPGQLIGQAMAEGRRGLAPLALGLQGGRLALRGAHAALIGPRPPEEDESLKLLRLIAQGGQAEDGAPGDPDSSASMTVNTRTGEILHDPATDRPLLGSRIHRRASRFRGYRIASGAARIGYGATLGLPGNARAGRRKASQLTQDAHTQLRVAAHQVRQDAGEWAPVGRATVAAGRAVGHGVDHVSQRVATAWEVHDPATTVRTAARDAAAGAVIFTSTPPVGDPSPRGAKDTTASHPVDPAADARQRVFDALMRAQRATWDNPPSQDRGIAPDPPVQPRPERPRPLHRTEPPPPSNDPPEPWSWADWGSDPE